MGTATFVEEFKAGLQFVALEGQPNLFVIHTPRPQSDGQEANMTDEDWNEFERHIAGAFERVP
jgi:hypothetical protein